MSDNEGEVTGTGRSPRIKKYHMRQYLRLLQKKENLQERWRAHYEDLAFKSRNAGRLKVVENPKSVAQGEAPTYRYYTRKELCLLADKNEEFRDNTRKEISKLKSEIEQGVTFEAWRDILIREGIDLDRVHRQELSKAIELIAAEEAADSTD